LEKYHHLIVDGWSISLITQSLAEIYTYTSQGQAVEIAAAPSYLSFINNDRVYLESERYQIHHQYWRKKYQTLPEPLFVPRYLSHFVDQVPPSERRVLPLARPFYNRLIAIAKSCEVTTFHLILGAFYVYLTRTSQTEELVVGLPILNRSSAAFKDTVGLFVGVSAARFAFGTDLSFKTLLQSIGQELKQNYRSQRFPISELNRDIGLHKVGRKQLFDFSVSYEKHDYDASFDVYPAHAKTLLHGYEQTPLMIYVREFHDNEDVDIDFVYNLAYFDAAEIERIQSRFRLILEYIATHLDDSIRTIPLLTKTEKQQLIAWNQTKTDYPIDKTIVDLFQEQVEKTPANIAVVFEEQQLSYRELNQKANQLAHYLMTLGVKAETLVGICVERSLEMVIGLLGILKAGGAYVPLDPDYPKERLQFMLEESAIKVLLSQNTILERLPETKAKVICLDTETEVFSQPCIDNPISSVSPTNLAYMIYTSGSTGLPKGVQINHQNVINLLKATDPVFHFDKSDVWTVFHSYAFDFSVWEIWIPLLYGCRLVVVSHKITQSPEVFYNLLCKERVTILNQTPAAISQFLQIKEMETRNVAKKLALRLIICGGEAFPKKLARQLLEWDIPIWNFYGPTEATVWASIHPIEAVNTTEGMIPIGRPLANTQLYILDAHLQPVPLDVPGELYIAGKGLARGYLNRPELTQEKFIEINIFGKFQRIYKTGDKARWLPDGNLEYLGRLDHQVKLRGFRIELGEIEARLSQHEAIKEAVVMLYNKENNPCLVAYVTLSTPIDEISKILRTWLKARLPEYMLPASFTVLDKLPLTQNGKIDRKALPIPDLSIQIQQQTARTETEHLLCNLWSQVLGIKVTSRLTNFFEAGGHSLLATQLVSRIRENFGIEMPLQIIFEQPILQEQAEWLDSEQRGSVLPPINPLVSSEPFVLSFAQQRLWFLAQLEGQSATYNMPAALHLSGQLNETALQRALTALIQRHDSLRLCFPVVDGKATVKLNEVYNPLRIIDLSELPETKQQSQINEWITNNAQITFNLNTGPLLNLHLLKLGQQKQILLFNMHHIISDGWSIGILVRDLTQLYNAYAQNQEPQLSQLPIQYTDYAVWQRNWLQQSQVLKQQLAYWTDKLTGIPELLKLPIDYPRSTTMSYQGKHLQSTLDTSLTRGIQQLSQQQGVTVFMILLAAFKVLLFRYSAQNDLVVGSPIANRTHHQTENLIGLFVNTLVLRTQIEGTQTFSKLLKQVRKTALEAYSHQDIPFEYLVEQLKPSRSLSYSPLFQVMFVLQNAPQEVLELSGLKMSFLEPEQTTAKFDLTLSIREQDETLVCHWEYNTDLFRSATIARMTEHFQVLLEGILHNPEQLISQLPLLAEAEKQQLHAWNQTDTDYPLDKTIVDLFQEQVEKTPANIAVVFEEQQLSYRELNQKANQLAHYLITLGIKAETLVGICVERSLEMVIGLLGILKAGGAYVPLDPSYPTVRLTFMLEDAKMLVLLTQTSLTEKLPKITASMICLDTKWDQLSHLSSDNPSSGVRAENLAYVIYTSGSTGKPKGVAIEHSSTVALLTWSKTVFTTEQLACVLASTSLNFDLSIFELFVPLTKGGKVILVKNALHLPTLSEDVGVTLVNTVPSAINELVKMKAVPASVQVVNLAGEPFQKQLVQQLYQIDTIQQVFNLYGPSEDTTYSTFALMKKGSTESLTIGHPIANTQIYILDNNQKRVPIGVAGELYIGGAGLARGYLNRPELSASKFIPNPFSQNNKDARLYKSGDLARYLPDGNIEYLGRIDNQVKIRGFRIELGEIEAVLTQHSAVKETIVIVPEETLENKRLIAIVIPQPEQIIEATELRHFLQAKLPDYMIPSAFVSLETMPLTPNGKVDRRALSQLSLDNYPLSEEAFVAPRTPEEELLAGIWTSILGIKPVGIHDNFFELGGHSLLATQVVSRIRDTFSIELPLRHLFESPTIAGLSEHLQTTRRDELPPITPFNRESSLPLSFAQQRLWFLNQLEEKKATYNMFAAVRLEGSLHYVALEKSFTEIVQRHETLRTTFPTVNGQPTPAIHSLPIITHHPLPIVHLQTLPKQEQEQEVQRLSHDEAQYFFDLSEGPLFRTTLLQLSSDSYLLLVNMHHIISDGWSIGILIRELSTLYEAFSQGKPSPLPPLPIQYVDFASWQQQCLSSEVFESQLAYWKQQLAGTLPTLPLLADYPKTEPQNYQGASQSLVLSSSLTKALKILSQQQNATLFMTLLAAFKIILYRYTDIDDIIVGTPIALRNRYETEGLIGLFLNTLALRTDLSGNPSFQELLQRFCKVALDAYAHQETPFEKLVEELQPTRNLNRHPIFDILFNFINTPSAALELSGLSLHLMDMPLDAKFLMTLYVEEQDGVLNLRIVYQQALFSKQHIMVFLSQYQYLLEQIVVTIDTPINSYSLITPDSQSLLPDPSVVLSKPQYEIVTNLILSWAKRTPTHPAISQNHRTWSYRELVDDAQMIARVLLSYGVQRQEVVAVLISRRFELIASMIGVWLSGGVLLTLDENLPRRRQQIMLKEAQAKYLLHLGEKPPAVAEIEPSITFISMDPDTGYPIDLAPGDIVLPELTPADAAYIFFTSGTTGIPKGVLGWHNGLSHFLNWQRQTFEVGPQDRCAQLTGLSFDVVLRDIFLGLISGATLCLPNETRDLSPDYILPWLEQEQISILHTVPSLLQSWLVKVPPDVSLRALRKIFIAGEPLTDKLVRQWRDAFPESAEIINLYGPTETTLAKCYYRVPPDMIAGVQPLGSPLPHTQALVLANNQQLCGISELGEIVLRTPFRSLGYINASDENQQRFVKNPFSNDEQDILYYSGDRGRYRPDGLLEILGRVDNQIKIRGIRIELEEIEALLDEHPKVQKVIVMVSHEPEKQLVAYVVPNQEQVPTSKALRHFLKTHLPDYMIPAAFVHLKQMPLTPNGKIDRRALAQLPVDSLKDSEETFVAPRTPEEKRLAEIWASVLNVKQVGCHDNFLNWVDILY
jgi:amino acid adenylation domain-containing protein